jgi:signal transduction histidine kinase
MSKTNSAYPYKQLYRSLNDIFFSTPENTYSTIIREAIKLTDGKYGSVFLAEDDNLQRVYASSDILYTNSIRSNGNTYKVYKKNKPYLLHRESIAKYNPYFKNLRSASDIAVPLTVDGMSIGVISVMSKEQKKFSTRELHLLKLLTATAAVAIYKQHRIEELQSAVADRDLFLSMAGHEIRTPITSIHGYTRIIADQVKRNIMPSGNLINHLEHEETRLKKLVEELLEVNRIKTGKLRFDTKECDLLQILERTVADFSMMYPAHTITFTYDKRRKYYPIWADFDKLVQAFTNITNNAGKFSKPGSSVYIDVKNSKKQYHITITDTGPGISKEDLPHVFLRYYKGDQMKRGGMGLGLYLVQHIIESHEGSVDIISEQGKGTQVIVKLWKIE